MGRLIALGMGAIMLFAPSTALAEIKTANTVRGQLTVKCSAKSQYQYLLAGKSIRGLSSECTPGHGASHISIEQVFRSKMSTTILVIEGVSATAQNVRVIHIPLNGSASVVDSLGGDGYALVQKTPTVFRLTAPAGGFAISDDRQSTWTCVIDIDFGKGRASGDLAVPYEHGLPRSVCDAEITFVGL